jgi:hypothetical protein
VRVGSGLASATIYICLPCASPHFAPVVGAYAIRAPAFCYHPDRGRVARLVTASPLLSTLPGLLLANITTGRVWVSPFRK